MRWTLYHRVSHSDGCRLEYPHIELKCILIYHLLFYVRRLVNILLVFKLYNLFISLH